MAYNMGFFRSLWHSIKDQVVQDVPQGIAFCEFQCTRKQCTLELTGSCNIRPEPALVFIQLAPASDHPQWTKTSVGGRSITPVHVH
jgi:hypothetical protein